MEIQQIETRRITEDPLQPRKHHSEESLQGLADSIRQHGMLNPITVTSTADEGRFQIVTGERRWRAAKLARLSAIPCVVKDLAADERLTVQLIENLQREDLQPLEKAKAILHVKTNLNLTNRELSRRLGLSERAVGYLLDLLALPEDIGEAVVSSPNRPSDGQVTEKHARFLKQLNEEPDLQSAVVERIRDNKLNSEDTGNLVKALKKRPDRAQEILESPADHLARFFQDSGAAVDLSGDDAPRRPAARSAYAQRITDFLPSLSGVDLGVLTLPEVRQIEDSLTSLRIAVDALLTACKARLEG
ncbi:MAG TPA: ParB/RepB/Spo0J family partition protein [Chthonomonadaceae bacterium]|nr:ParB/RepB/Spo0J family partition protein [Chthonomonadaceae bacterium]